MTNTEIAQVFTEIANLLEPSRENIFKIRAYQKAAKAIEDLPVKVEELTRNGRLREIPGVGQAIAKKITELVNTGRLEYLDKLKSGPIEVKN